MQKIITFGSCMSRYTANAYRRLFGAELLGSVYHNRVDRFYNIYVERSKKEVSPQVLRPILSDPNALPVARIMIENQLSDGTLGKHAGVKPGFLSALEQPVDLIICDNFCELIARLQFVEDQKYAGMWINQKDLGEARSAFALEPQLLDLETAREYWFRFSTWLRSKQPAASIVFVNFPYEHHPKTQIVERCRAFAESFASETMHVVPLMKVPPVLLKTTSHFSHLQYAMYAGYIRDLQGFRRKHAEDNEADDLLLR